MSVLRRTAGVESVEAQRKATNRINKQPRVLVS